MRKALIIYFSGTGNTKYVAELFINKLFQFKIDLIPVERLLNSVENVSIDEYELIGIGCPSIGFNVPRIIMDYCRTMPIGNLQKVFLFLTCAGPCYLNDTAFFGLKRLLNQKRYLVIAEKAICMPANIIFDYPIGVVKQLLITAEKKVEKMSFNIINGVNDTRKDKIIPYTFRGLLIVSERLSLWSVPIDFYVSNDCTKCLLCIKNCPRNNIKVSRKVKFSTDCEACFRCVYACPNNAIRGRLYGFLKIKKGYNINNLLKESKNASNDFMLTGIYKTMKKYFEII
jgi:ferredoxin